MGLVIEQNSLPTQIADILKRLKDVEIKADRVLDSLSSGVSGTFTTTDGKTITIVDGVVTSIV